MKIIIRSLKAKEDLRDINSQDKDQFLKASKR